MTQFALFAGEDFYPEGGWRDLVGIFDSIEDAIDAFDRGFESGSSFEWGQIVNLATRSTVQTFGLGHAR